ncbi:helix-turn-helix domain-containing protein [bacterium]|nr:helix-turn-helix domain-containing protein [bacterium]
MEKLLDIGELARILGVKVSTIYGWVSEKQIPHYKLGRLVRFDRHEIIEWLKSRKISGRKTRLPENDPLYSR